ncbi:MAG: penicillin-binding protein 2 [Pyrinomonadaceae bacterium]
MRFADETQNLRSRLRAVQVLVCLLLVALAARLYFLQVVNGAYYAEKAENQRVRKLPIPAQRGTIFARSGKILVDSRPSYNAVLARDEGEARDLMEFAAPLAEGLGVDEGLLRARLDAMGSQPAFESFVVKQDLTPGDIAWIEAHSENFAGLRVEQQPQRRYPANGTLAHVLGYVGEVNPKQLASAEAKERDYKPGDIVGQEGLEKVYDRYLRGRDGYRKVIVDSRGQVREEIERVEPQPGQDLVTTIDLDLQLAAEEQLRGSESGRGVMIALDPNSGEILALASAPTFDPNLFSQRVATKEGIAEFASLLKDRRTPLYNRAIQGRYPPGSTWKIPMATGGLMQGAISVEDSRLVCGGGIQIGNRFTHCMGGNHGTLDLRTAITHSCDGYFFRLGLKMGLEGIMKMVDTFDLDKPTGVDLPHELVSWTPSRELKAKVNPRDAEWGDIDTVYASFGQGTDVVTPLALLRVIAGIGVGGKFYTPHLLREVRAEGEPGAADYRPAAHFERLAPKIVAIPEEDHRLVVEGMWGVVNNGGTASRIKMAGFDIAGKTGTAQVVSTGKDVGERRDHSWFVSYAPAWKPEIAILGLIENVGQGGHFAAPAVRAVYDVYYRETRGALPPPAAIARATKPQAVH